MSKISWHLISGRNLDFRSSIGSYTLNLSQGLSEAGCEVHLWFSPGQEVPVIPQEFKGKIHIQRVPFSWNAKAFQFLGEALDKQPGQKRLFVQFSPDSFGEREWNLALPGWLEKRQSQGDDLWLMVHKTFKPGLRFYRFGRWLVTFLQKRMLRKTLGVSRRVFVSTPNLIPFLKELRPDIESKITWLPIPGNVKIVKNSQRALNLRKAFAQNATSVIGTFGSYRDKKLTRLLKIMVPGILSGHPDRVWLCLGRESEPLVVKLRKDFPDIASQMEIGGELDPEALSAHIQACDLMLQPFPDGVDTSRTSVMVGLSHGRPVATTIGSATETVWRQTGCVSLCPGDRPDVMAETVGHLLDDEAGLEALAKTGARTYQERFSLTCCIASLTDS